MQQFAHRLGRTVVILHLLTAGCTAVVPSKGGGQTAAPPTRQFDPRDIALPSGYRIEIVATGLTYPTGVTFDAQNRPHVLEGGYSYGEDFRPARLLRIDSGKQKVVTSSEDGVPWTGVSFRDGAFYIAQGGVQSGGRIVRVAGDGTTKTLIADLPSRGDHHTNGPAIGPDGAIYFGVGTATNSGVVGTDNYKFGWLKRSSGFHDIPGKDIKLAGKNFSSANPLTPDDGSKAKTGAFSAFGTPTRAGQVIRGQMPCTGAIMRIAPQGGAAQLVAWGLRNPFGLRFGGDGMLYVTENQFDDRGSRPSGERRICSGGSTRSSRPSGTAGRTTSAGIR
jgi:glucose/arabinose dehydrogenase